MKITELKYNDNNNVGFNHRNNYNSYDGSIGNNKNDDL